MTCAGGSCTRHAGERGCRREGSGVPRLPLRSKVLLLTAVVAVGAAVPAFGSAPKPAPAPVPVTAGGAAAGYSTTHFGEGNLPAGCIVDRDQDNPDNQCHHLKVGLNNLDSPKVNVAVLVPVSPTAERDMRIMRQSVEMWGGGLDHLARQMDMDWLADGVEFNVTTKLVPVDANGVPTKAVNLISPKIVVIATNPVGGIGIGIDPADFMGEVGFTDGKGLPCGTIPDPFNLKSWQERPGFDGHHGELGGFEVVRCEGTGGQVCFSVNGAVDPVPGTTDFFSLYDLVSHENGHCLTLGHVGDGAEGPWGEIPTHDIMAYSSDPVDVAKCVSTLDVEGFAIQMSQFLDVNGDGKVDGKDPLTPNDPQGDGMNSFQVQNPKDHWYASATGRPEDCPQPDWGLAPLAEETDWQPAPVSTRTPTLALDAAGKGGRVAWDATARWTTTQAPAKGPSATVEDPTGDGATPMTDLTGFTATVTKDAVEATISVDQLWPTTEGGRVTGYGLYVGGRKFDSFVITQGTDSEVQTIDSGARHIMPAGTSTWDTEKGTVSFTIPRSYLADQRIMAPYDVYAASGIHIRTKDWVTGLDRAPDTGAARLSGPPMAVAKAGSAPIAKKPATRTVELEREGPDGNTFTPADTSTYGVPLVPQVGNNHVIPLPVKEQATAEVTLTWDDPSSYLGLEVKGGSGQEVAAGNGSVTVTVPWAPRDLAVRVIPSQIGSESVSYTLTATLTSLTANADGDGVPDVADVCKSTRGPVTSGGCPDTDRDGILDIKDRCATTAARTATGCPTAADERLVVLLDGKQVSSRTAMTRHGSYGVAGSVKAARGTHTLTLVWYSGSKVVKKVERTVQVR